MRQTRVRIVLLSLAMLVLLPLVACAEGDSWTVAADRTEAGVGEKVAVTATLTTSQPGCGFLKGGSVDNPRERVTFEVEPEGARVGADGTFVADEPGTYKILVWDHGARKDGAALDGAFQTMLAGTVQITVSEDGSVTAGEPDAGPSPLVGKWEFPEKGINIDTGEITKTRTVTVSQNADGSLTATWDFGATAPATYDAKTGEVVIDGGVKGDFARRYVGTLDGDTITGTQDYSGSATGGKMDAIVQGKATAYDFNQPWSAKRAE